MSDNTTTMVRRPGTDPPADARARLREAIQALRDDQERHAAIEDGREKARRRRWEIATQVDDIKAELAAAEADEGGRLAYAFINSTTNSDSPVKTVTIKLEACQQHLTEIVAVEAGLDREIEGLQRRLRHRQTAIREHLTNLVCNSPEYHALFAFSKIADACGGAMSQADFNKWQRVESFSHEATNIAIDPEPGAAWAEALRRLIEDPSTELPGPGG
jgi:hypothetical protein